MKKVSGVLVPHGADTDVMRFLLEEASVFSDHTNHSLRLNFQQKNVLKYVVCIHFRDASDSGLDKNNHSELKKGENKVVPL